MLTSWVLNLMKPQVSFLPHVVVSKPISWVVNFTKNKIFLFKNLPLMKLIPHMIMEEKIIKMIILKKIKEMKS